MGNSIKYGKIKIIRVRYFKRNDNYGKLSLYTIPQEYLSVFASILCCNNSYCKTVTITTAATIIIINIPF